MDPAGKKTGHHLSTRQYIAIGIVLCIVLLILALLVLHPSARIAEPQGPVHVKILAVNDLHGQLPAGQTLDGKAAGSAPVLASYLHAAENESPDAVTFLAFPGDLVGASPPESGLLLDEPAILFTNQFATGCCGTTAGACTVSCNLIATPGNHEFDRGVPAMFRLVQGGNGTTGITHLADPYPGSKAAYVCANVVWTGNKTPLFPPYVIRDAGGAKIAFIGADTAQTPSVSSPTDMNGIAFENESEAINRYIPEIQAQGVHAIVALIHEGGSGDAYYGPTRDNATVSGRIAGIASTLDPDVDVVLSAHTHKFSNAYLNNSGNRPVLVTQAYSYSRGFADIDLEIDPATDEIVNKSARIVPAYADHSPGTTPDPEALELLAEADAVVSKTTDTVEAVAAENITRDDTVAGESVLGDLLVDSERDAMHADAAFITIGTLRANIAKGNVTWGDLYAVQPFSNRLYAVSMSGRQIRDVLERQWTEPRPPYRLGVSGLTYTYDPARPAGDRVTQIKIGGAPENDTATYRVAIVSYLLEGGDGYTEFANATILEPGPLDVDALSAYIGSLPQPVTYGTDNRIRIA
jgi:5'-nucleotidase